MLQSSLALLEKIAVTQVTDANNEQKRRRISTNQWYRPYMVNQAVGPQTEICHNGWWYHSCSPAWYKRDNPPPLHLSDSQVWEWLSMAVHSPSDYNRSQHWQNPDLSWDFITSIQGISSIIRSYLETIEPPELSVCIFDSNTFTHEPIFMAAAIVPTIYKQSKTHFSTSVMTLANVTIPSRLSLGFFGSMHPNVQCTFALSCPHAILAISGTKIMKSQFVKTPAEQYYSDQTDIYQIEWSMTNKCPVSCNSSCFVLSDQTLKPSTISLRSNCITSGHLYLDSLEISFDS